MSGPARVRARVEPSLGAQVIARTALLYRDGAHPNLDRPAHVRAGSALARLDSATLAVVQDDASFVAILRGVGTADLVVEDVPLPSSGGVRQFDEGRGNKKAKLDLEACLALHDGALLIAFGSGSSPERELNVEGAALAGDDVLFLQRGNGAPFDERLPVDASARVDRAQLVAYLLALVHGDAAPCPPLRDVVGWDLGHVGANDTRLTFTDAVAARGTWTAFLACAENSPDATRPAELLELRLGERWAT